MIQNAKNIYKKCSEQGIYLWVDGEKLKFKAPKGAFTDELKSSVKEYKSDLIAYICSLEAQKLESHNKEEELFLLTDVQYSYLIGRENIYDYGGIGCHAYVEAELPKCNRERMEKAWHRVIDKHDMLRAVIMREGYQKVVKEFSYPTIKENIAENTLQDTVLEVRNRLEKKNYLYNEPPLYEIEISSDTVTSVIHFSMDMLLADSISMGVILNDLLDFYDNPEQDLRKPQITFQDVILFHEIDKEKPSQKVKREIDKTYWLNRMPDFPDAPRLYRLKEVSGKSQADFEQLEFTLEKSLWKSFSKYAKESQLTPSIAVLNVYANCLALWSGNKHFGLNVTTMLRPAYHEEINQIVGDFTSNTILEINLSEPSTYQETASKVQKQLWADMEHTAYSGIEVLRELNRRRKYAFMMPYVYTSTLGIEALDNQKVNIIYKTSQTPQVFIDCQVSETRGDLSVVWTVRKGIFADKTIALMFDWMESTIRTLAEQREAWRTIPKVDYTDEDLEYYVSACKVLNGEEKQWICQQLVVDTQQCEQILVEKLGVEATCVSSEEEIDIYLIPKESKDIAQMTEIDERIQKNTRQQAELLCKEIDEEMFVKEIEVANRCAIIDILQAFRKAGAFCNTTTGYEEQELVLMLQVTPEYNYLMQRWLQALLRENYIQQQPDQKYYAIVQNLEETRQCLLEDVKKILEKNPDNKGIEEYISTSSEHLLDIVSGKLNPLEFLFPNGESDRAHEIYHDLFSARMMNELVVKAAESIAEGKRQIRVLEIGAGVGGTTDEVLPVLKKYKVDYYFTDISTYYLQEAKKKYTEYPFVTYGFYDFDQSCYRQGVIPGSFDMIIIANTYHNASNGQETLKKLREVLAPDGYIIIVDSIFEMNALLTSKGMLHTAEINDSRKNEKRIFYSDREFRAMFDELDMDLVDYYPNKNDFFASAELMLYVVRNRKQYQKISKSEIFELLRKQLRVEEKLGKVVVSPYLPVTQDKKINRKILCVNGSETEMSVASSQECVLPSTLLEVQISKVWKEVFETSEDISIDTSFFEMGGDSLLASMVVTKMRSRMEQVQKLEWNELMNLLLKNSTIRKLADAIEKNIDVSESEPDYVIVYQKGSEKPDKIWAFFVNGTATMPIYQPMYELLKKEIPNTDCVVGFHCGKAEKFLAIPEEKLIDEMAYRNSRYLCAKSAAEYQLIGHCFGGGVAIATANLMKEKAVDNIKVMSIDSRRWHGHYDNALFFEKGFGEMYGADMSKCGYTVSDFVLKKTMGEYQRRTNKMLTQEEMCNSEFVPEEVRECFSRLAKIPETERIRNIFAQVENTLSGGFDEKSFIAAYYMFRKILSAFTMYKPQVYDGVVDVFIAKDLRGFFNIEGDINDMDYARDAVVNGGNRIFIDGDHFSCMEGESLKKIIEFLMGRITAEEI